jgi:2-polyprenyl-3-methyl-5-hydroxy-6-metoxy-1,4-benzoquinol methylase
MTCPICGGGGPFPSAERHGRFALRWCRACDLQFADPMEEAGRSFYEREALYTGAETLYTSPRVLQWDQRRFLADRPHPGGVLVDVGCGTGYFAAAARDAGYRVIGLDWSRPQLETARRRYGLTDLHAVTLAEYVERTTPGSTDVVTAFQVLEHVADPLAFLGQARALLAPGGALAVGVPHAHAWSIFRHPLDAPPNHLTRWSRRSLTRALDRAGFEVVTLSEQRSAYPFLLRYVRLGLLRWIMRRTARSAPEARPHPAVLGLSIAKARLLEWLDIPARGLLTAVGAPGVLVYALARARA